MRVTTLLVTCVAAVAGSATQLRAVYVPREVQQQQDSNNVDAKYVLSEVIASEFERHVPVLSDNLRGELNALRNDINRQFDSLKHHMDVKLDRMQRDAPERDATTPEAATPRQEAASPATPAATIRHNLAMAELRRLGADLTQTMNEEVARLRQDFTASLHDLRDHVDNATAGLAVTLGEEFSTQAQESTTLLKKVFFLTRNQMTLIQGTLSNITAAIRRDPPATTLPPPPPAQATHAVTKGITTHQPPPGLSTLTHTTNTDTTDTTEPALTTTDHTTTTTTVPTTTTEPEDLPKDCAEALNSGMIRSGVTKIRPSAEMKPKPVWCEQKVVGGGWSVMLWRRKQPTQIDFRRTWKSYVEGFGDPDGEYWIGTRGYELNVGGYNKSSTGGDALEYHNGMEFSTFNQDNDGSGGGSCSEWSGGGGWWFNYCYYSNPTAIYPPADLPPNTQVDHLVEWRKWQGYYTYLSTFRMMIRPN
ncbi:Angiopoietin-related protein 1 [Chionoecetes opilio]|uniref:Angiopoietin-related protein 1 n=1 Tax=Chionoecetes opilio TaxID=41210 RepID=A0A8J4YZ89_CHIOP|nr:Angiopoietin-related protein 1 [Chionoecetes opilio]